MQNPSDPFAFMRSQWSGLGAGFQFPNQAIPPTSVADLERRIADLKTVQQWLSLNLNILNTTIQGLEIQRGTLAAVQSFQEAMGQFQTASPSGSEPAPNDPNEGPAPSPQVDQARRQAAAWWQSMQGQLEQLVQQAQSVTQVTAQAADATVRAGQDLASRSAQATKPGDAAKAPGAARARRRSRPKSPPAQPG